jgi:hypothetical protein
MEDAQTAVNSDGRPGLRNSSHDSIQFSKIYRCGIIQRTGSKDKYSTYTPGKTYITYTESVLHNTSTTTNSVLYLAVLAFNHHFRASPTNLHLPPSSKRQHTTLLRSSPRPPPNPPYLPTSSALPTSTHREWAGWDPGSPPPRAPSRPTAGE